MGRAVNLVVSCSNRKRYETAPGLAAHKLAGSDVRETPKDLEREAKNCTSGEVSCPGSLYGRTLVRRP